MSNSLDNITDEEFEEFCKNAFDPIQPSAQTITTPTGYQTPLDLTEKEGTDGPVEVKCECGVDSTGGGIHSTWCSKS